MSRRRLVIVGAGPAGLAAAIAAAEAGVTPLVLDEQPRVGGQIYRQAPPGLSPETARRPSAAARRGAELLRRFDSLRDHIDVWNESGVWAIFPSRRLAITGPRGGARIEAEQLILAPGAYEYVPPFPGWTLPGVMTPGCAQQLTKILQVRPGKRAVVAGTGPFLLVVAEQLHQAGIEVAAVVEAAPSLQALRALPGLLRHMDQLREGLGYFFRLRRAGIPVLRGQMVVEARGGDEVREVVVTPCDKDWHPDFARARTIAADTLCIGYGFVPRTQLAQMAGCRLRFVDEQGGWIPVVDENLETSVPGVWAAGDGGGVAGALIAQEEGTLAGLAAAHRLDALAGRAFSQARKPILNRLKRLRRFRAALDGLSRLRSGLTTLAKPETLVCRCEEVTRAEIEAGRQFGATNLRTLKVMTRLGMGACQGCMCWPAAARWLAAQTGKSMEEIGPLSVRPPILPLSMGDLAQEDSADTLAPEQAAEASP